MACEMLPLNFMGLLAGVRGAAPCQHSLVSLPTDDSSRWVIRLGPTGWKMKATGFLGHKSTLCFV